LSGNDNIQNEVHYVASNSTFFLKNAENFIVLMNISSLPTFVTQ